MEVVDGRVRPVSQSKDTDVAQQRDRHRSGSGLEVKVAESKKRTSRRGSGQ